MSESAFLHRRGRNVRSEDEADTRKRHGEGDDMSLNAHVDDLRQEYALEQARAAAEGRRPRPKRWVEADYWRRELGRSGARATVALDVDVADAPRTAAIRAGRKSLADRALAIAAGLPCGQREPILLALRCLAAPTVSERLRAWLDAFPDRRATHAEIAREIGASRWTVSRIVAATRRSSAAQARRARAGWNDTT
jgi:hypothetical protein